MKCYVNIKRIKKVGNYHIIETFDTMFLMRTFDTMTLASLKPAGVVPTHFVEIFFLLFVYSELLR